MPPRFPIRAAACAGLLALALVPSASAQRSPAAPAAAPVQASTGFLGGPVRFRGTAPAGARVVVERRSPRQGWVRTATARAGADGRFLARWRADEVGRFAVRTLVRGRSRSARAGSAAGEVVVFRRVRATWYGPGLYGNRTACGQVMTEDLMGVAHRTLPCGTPVEVRVGRASLTVPVVDRGPYANGAHYDLTAALARNLGFLATGDLGVLPVRGATMEPPPAPDRVATGRSGGAAAAP